MQVFLNVGRMFGIMVKLDKEQIKYLTELSRIACSDEEQDALLEDLGKILNYVEQMAEVDTENVAPCNHVLEGMQNVMREDVVGESMPREVFLANAPEQIGGMIRVPTVIKNRNSKG